MPQTASSGHFAGDRTPQHPETGFQHGLARRSVEIVDHESGLWCQDPFASKTCNVTGDDLESLYMIA